MDDDDGPTKSEGLGCAIDGSLQRERFSHQLYFSIWLMVCLLCCNHGHVNSAATGQLQLADKVSTLHLILLNGYKQSVPYTAVADAAGAVVQSLHKDA